MTTDRDFRLMAAPLQGFTESPFRHFHAEIYGTDPMDLTYFSPFMRFEKGDVRPRDMREITTPLNGNHRLVPQIIFKNPEEFTSLVDKIRASGHNAIDLNMGCPFVPQVRKGRGAGMLSRPDTIKEIGKIIEGMPEITFSLKMRLGIDSPTEWQSLADIINHTPLDHVTIHPRTASQQYSGELHTDEFGKFAKALIHPIIFNGDICTPAMIENLRERYPEIKGVMAGRGLLMRPSLFNEWVENREWSREERTEKLLRLHSAIFSHYRSTLTGGDAQILSKIKPKWEYFGADFERKAVKKILKANSLANYTTAISSLTSA